MRRLKKSHTSKPTVLFSTQHKVDRTQIGSNVLTVLTALYKEGHESYLVGGAVRDLWLGRKPKDFDIATSATPEQVRKIFRNSRIIGKRFKLVHVYFRREIIEVSTFRASLKRKKHEERTMVHKDNTYGSVQEDAWRRDFTVNALYFRPSDSAILDFTDAIHDLKTETLRLIGSPEQRFHEDPVRMLRAIRLAAKLEFSIEEKVEEAIYELRHLLAQVPEARLFDEVSKMLFSQHALASYQRLRQYQYLEHLFPAVHNILESRLGNKYEELIQLAMQATDARLRNEQGINPAFLMSILLWPDLQEKIKKLDKRQKRFYMQMYKSIDDVMATQAQTMRIPKRFYNMIRSVWLLQFHLEHQRPARIERIIQHRYFRAAIDFYELRAETRQANKDKAKWWRQYEKACAEERENLIIALRKKKNKGA